MKTIHTILEDEEFEEVNKIKIKSGLSWHDFILSIAENLRKKIKQSLKDTKQKKS